MPPVYNAYNTYIPECIIDKTHNLLCINIYSFTSPINQKYTCRFEITEDNKKLIHQLASGWVSCSCQQVGGSHVVWLSVALAAAWVTFQLLQHCDAEFIVPLALFILLFASTPYAAVPRVLQNFSDPSLLVTSLLQIIEQAT